MSLFSVCNWWFTQCNDLAENYDVASLLCARIGLESQEKDYVIVGSHSGYLSIFYPSPELEGNGDRNAFKPTDLLLETQLSAPILGVYVGRFSGNQRNENSNQLGVLHPNSIAIYNIQNVTGLAEHGTQLRLQLQVEYKFRRVAFSLCKGHFGQVKGREFFCVVHLDGMLTFYEQDGISYECKFPGHRALPTPVVYCERTDSFFRLSATWNLECYSYQDLSHSSSNTRPSYEPSWSVCIGEGIVDMCVVQVKEDSSWMLLLGERNFICLNDTGKINFILKLDYVPKCFHSFVVGYYWEPSSRLITAIVADNSKLFVYEEASIIWAAQYQCEAPVAIKRSNVNGLPGSIVTLGPNGQLCIGYLGSDPYLFKVPPLNVEELSFAQARSELQQLEDEIKEAVDVSDMDGLNQQAADNVRLNFTIRTSVTDELDTLLLDMPADVAVKELSSATGTLKLRTRIDLVDLQLVFNTPPGVRCTQETLFLADIPAGTTKELELGFYIAELLHVHSARVDVVVSFINTKGIPRVVQQSAYLPLSMFFKAHAPQKSAGIKMTYTIRSQSFVPKLATLFPEFVTWDSEVQALGLLLQCPGKDKLDEIITIVAAKNSNRIRLQSDYLEAFALISERLIQATVAHDDAEGLLKRDKKRAKKGVLNRRVQSIMAAPFIPVQAILHRVDLHHETQESIRRQTENLDGLWSQFKTLQRRLQEKQDDDPKETLVMQIEENYDHLILEGDKLTEMRKDESKQRSDLNCALAVANAVIACLNLEERVVNVILSVLSLPVDDWTELSWEESMSPGIEMLHHFGPLCRSRTAANSNGLIDTNSTQTSLDFARLRRHLATLFDRVVRVASLEPQKTQVQLPKEPSGMLADPGAQPKDEITYLQRMLELDAGKRGIRHSSLEAVADDDEDAEEDEQEEDEYDEDDLRDVGYRRNYGIAEAINNRPGGDCSDWINEDFELPTTEELFSDLGIWW